MIPDKEHTNAQLVSLKKISHFLCSYTKEETRRQKRQQTGNEITGLNNEIFS